MLRKSWWDFSMASAKFGFGEGLLQRVRLPHPEKSWWDFLICMSQTSRPRWVDAKREIQAFPPFPCLSLSGTFRIDHSPPSCPGQKNRKGGSHLGSAPILLGCLTRLPQQPQPQQPQPRVSARPNLSYRPI